MNTTYGLRRALLLNRNGVAVMSQGRQRTFAELGDRVARLAAALKELGVAEGERVAVLSLNQDRYLELYLGVAWAGAVIVPLNIRWSALGKRGRGPRLPPENSRRRRGVRQDGARDRRESGRPSRRLRRRCAENPAPAAMLDYEELIAKASPCPTPRSTRKSWPAFSIPEARRAAPRA